MDRYNTRRCADCGKATSVVAKPIEALWKFGPIKRRVLVDESGEIVGYAHGDTSMIYIHCRGCGKWRIAHRVIGRVVKSIKCDARCQSATGFICDCSCGGKNHGSRHAA